MEGTLDGRQKGNEMQTKIKETVSKPTYAKRETDRVTQQNRDAQLEAVALIVVQMSCPKVPLKGPDTPSQTH